MEEADGEDALRECEVDTLSDRDGEVGMFSGRPYNKTR